MTQVTKAQAFDAEQRLKKLRRNAPTAGQLGRGALIGAGIGVAAAGTRALVSGAGAPKSPRQWLGQAASGAVFAGGAPWLRHLTETKRQEKKMRKFITRKPRSRASSKLQRTLGAKVASIALSPAARLAASKSRDASPRVSGPGPSIAQISKPVGYGRALAGATKSAFVDELSQLFGRSGE